MDDLREATTIDPMVLHEEFVRVPADLARWNALLSEAIDRHLHAKLAVEIGEAKLRVEHRTSAMARGAGGKGPTQGDIDALVLADPRYEEMRLAEISAEVDKSKLQGAVDAIRAKKDMIISLGAHIRAEMTPPQINTQARVAEMEHKAGYR